ncbi:MAG: hypothetical protein WC284_08490 [Candidimonas sp.]
MAYVINKTDGSQLITLTDRSIDASTVSLKLIGKNFPNYGEIMAENLVGLLENFSNTVPPISQQTLDGQLWWKRKDMTADPQSHVCGSGNPYPLTGNQLYAWSSEKNKYILIGPTSDGMRQVPLLITDINDDQYEGIGLVVNDELIEITITPSGSFTSIEPKCIETAEYQPIQFQSTNGSTQKYPKLFRGTTKVNSPNGSDPAIDRNGNVHAAHVIPIQTNQYDLGSADDAFGGRWRTLYVDSLDSPNWEITDGGEFVGIASSARYADLAERYHADHVYSPGTVVKLGGEFEITQTSSLADTDVFGVISTLPAYRMNSAAGDDQTHPYVALQGRIPCKVIGQVRKGARLMTSSIPGVAIAMNDLDIKEYGILAIIGRALEDKNTNDMGMIEISVGVK